MQQLFFRRFAALSMVRCGKHRSDLARRARLASESQSRDPVMSPDSLIKRENMVKYKLSEICIKQERR